MKKDIANKMIIRGSILEPPVIVANPTIIELYDDNGELSAFIKVLNGAFLLSTKNDDDWEEAKALAGLNIKEPYRG